MKKFIIVVILFFITTSIYAFNYKETNQYLGIGGGYTTSYVHFLCEDMYFKGPSITINTDSLKKEKPKYSFSIDYSLSFIDAQMDGYNLNEEYPTRYMFESFIGIKNNFLINYNLNFYANYGIHTNLITLESPENLWILFSFGSYASIGGNLSLNNDFYIDFGILLSTDFFNIYFTDYYFDGELFNDLNNSFIGFGGLGQLSILYKF